ncbi:MAG: dockerin type I repeat-containing protein [Clostridia bacterium]|nr:dockerin type I repeat-containing protein [Clostridia bacterium]
MKKTFLRFVSTALAAVMLFGCMNIGVFAADTTGEQNNVTSVPAPTVTVPQSNAPSAQATVEKTIASILAGSKTEFTAAEKAVLNAVALKSETFSYTDLGLGAEENVVLALTDTANTYTVKANAIASGLANMWVPVGGRAICEAGTVVFTLTDGEGIFTAEKIDHVEIDYALVISEISAVTANFVANLPYTLATEAVAQKEVLDYYAQDKIYNNLVNFATYMPVFDLVKANFGAETQAVIAELMEKCIHTTGDGDSLYLTEYISEYKAKGLAYYYAEGTYEAISEQLTLVKNAINVISADAKFQEIFTEGSAMDKTFPSFDLPGKKKSIDEIKTALNEKTLVPVNANIDRASAYLPALADAVEAAIGNSSAKTVSDVTLSKTLNVVAPDKTKVSIVVSVVNKDGFVLDTLTESVTYEIGTVLTENDAQDLEDLIADLEADLGIDAENYVCTVEGVLPTEGDTIAAPIVVSYVWAPVSYTIVIEGMEDQILYADGSGLTITLPGTGNPEEKYVYSIGNTEVNVGVENKTYTFVDVSVLKALCTDGELVIRRTVLNAAREDILAFVDAMNEAIAGKASVEVGGVKVPVITLIPVESVGGEISVIFRVTPYLQGVDYQGLVVDVMKVLTIDGNPFGTLKLNGKPLYDGKVYMQTVLDTVLSDNFGFDAICNMIDANGDIADITVTEPSLAGATVIDTEYDVPLTDMLGGKLIKAELQADSFKFPFYVTFEDYDQMAETLKNVEGALATVKDNINVTAQNGVLNVELVMPASFSAYYLAELLVMDQADLANIENMQLEEALAFMMSLIKPLVADEDFTLETIENTMAKVGQNVDLSQYVTEAQFATIRKALNYLFTKGELESEANGNAYSATVSYKIRDLLINRFHVDSMFLALVAEAGEDSKGISLSFTITDNTIATYDFDALVIDPNARDLSILTTTKDLADVLATAKENTVIVLLQDVTLSSDVVIPNRVFINLNGYTITGNMTTSAAVRITNSNLTACGGVNGELSGSFIITGGHYTTDVTSMIKDGYEIAADGCVENNYYIVSEDAEGNVTVAIKGDFLNLENAPTTQDALKDFAVDVAFDIALNMFTNASMSVNGNNIYTVELNNILGMTNDSKEDIAKAVYNCISFEGVTAIANELLAQLVDFSTMANAVVTGDAIASYEITTKGWNVVPEIVGTTDKYITLNVVPTEETKDVALTVVFAEMADEETAALSNLFENLAKTVTIDASINLGGIGYTNGNVTADITGAVDVDIDFSDDINYSTLILAAVAYSTPAQKDNCVEAINVFYEYGDINSIVEALDTVTAAQLVSALKAIATTDCEDMLAAIDLDNAEMVALEAVYAELLDIAGKVVNRLGIAGNNTTLGACKVADTMATYAFSRENVKGFDVDFSIVLVDEDTAITAEIIDVQVNAGGKIVSALVANGFIYLDVHYDGIEASDLFDLIEITTKHADSFGWGMEKGPGELICTGDIITIDAENVSGKVEETYVIVILGDANRDGKTNAGDAVVMAKYYVGKTDLEVFAELAADANRNNGVDAGDAVKVTGKYINWANYTSALE